MNTERLIEAIKSLDDTIKKSYQSLEETRDILREVSEKYGNDYALEIIRINSAVHKQQC